MKLSNLKLDGGKVEMSLETFVEMITFIDDLVRDNTDMNGKLNRLSEIVCEGIEDSVEHDYFSLHVNGYDVASIVGDRYEIEKQYEELKRIRKEKENERLSEVSKDTESVVCTKGSEEQFR